MWIIMPKVMVRAVSLLRIAYLSILIVRACSLLCAPPKLLARICFRARAVSASPRFHEYGLPTWLVKTCNELGYVEPTPVQRNVLPQILEGKDVVLQAHTGSGKTLAYALPVLSRIDPSRSSIQAVIVVPTRELCLQVSSTLKQLSALSPTPISVMPVMQGSKNRRQILWAAAEPPHIVVGNPTSLQRLVEMGKLRLNAVSTVVIDEVDACLIEHETREELHNLLSRHLSSSYSTVEEALQEDVRESRVYRDLAKEQERSMGMDSRYRLQRQTIFCSATIPQRQHFAMQCFKNGWTNTLPTLVNLSQDELVPGQVLHEHINCEASLRTSCLAYVLRKEFTEVPDGPASSAQAMVFLDDMEEIEAVAAAVESALRRSGEGSGACGVGVLDESRSLDARAKTMNDFRGGKLKVLLCSDLAGRGLDLPNTALVVQMSLPNRVERYIHRAGRTGRVGRPGKVISFTAPEEDFVVRRFSNDIGVPIVERKLKIKATMEAK